MDYLDMLAKLGVGNAHPGGFAATLKQLEQYPLLPCSRVLEVGCGTGRTACYAAAQGHDVTGLDIRPEMIAKAKVRAEKENLTAQFIVGDACSLPFPDGSFDVVLVESVSVFTDSAKAFKEYHRVLRSGGKLYDREMALRNPMPANILEEVTGFYKVDHIADLQLWSSLVQGAGFLQTQVEGPFLFPKVNEDLLQHPDPHQQIDNGSFLDLSVWEAANKYNSIMERYEEYIGYVLIMGTK